MEVRGYYLTHILAAVFPACAGVLLYGWRGAVTVVGVVGSAAAALVIWRRIGPRGRTLHYSHAIWFALLLALMLPAELASAGAPGGVAPWPIIPLAGLLVVILLWMLGGMGGGYVHPVIAAYLLMIFCFEPMLIPHRILNRDHVAAGDLFHSSVPDSRTLLAQPWISRLHNESDATYQEPAAEVLVNYTSGRASPARRQWLPLYGLLRDSMPPLEDFVIAGQPGPLGASSVIAVVIGGLFLLYRGLVDFRIPLIGCVAAYAALLILPIPSVIANEPVWHWMPIRTADIGRAVGITFVNYEIMVSPLIFTAFFLATAPSIRPMTRRGRAVFAFVFGITAAAFQLYVSVAYGPYLALLIVSLLTPELDRWFKVKPLVG